MTIAASTTLHRVARRRGRERETRTGKVGIDGSSCRHLVDHSARVLVLRELQIGIDHVVLTMELITILLVGLGGAHRARIGRDRFLPVADAGEDV